ncbi:unnamed protein product [Prunus armeniaca]|uniref:U1-type domain-containing protein n=1 Tax=Prunus armeniaca TaxID=36596 RepID=A0A6J5TZX6_PRUAR|nr:unnamed protein product [Prunus armeniaca]
MEYSYPQTHQEDHTQYQQYQQYQQQQQQQQEQQAAAAYDPSRIQAYDHSYQSYYPYNHQQQQYEYDQHQYQQYYNPTQDYRNSYDTTTTTQHQFHQEPTSIHPPGVPIPPEPPHNADPGHTHLQNAYYAHGVVEDQRQQQMNSGSGGLIPAAVAALSQLTQLSANMDAAQRATQPPIGQTPYRGGGRRGNRPFRGGGRGHFGYHGSRPDGSAHPFRGRGRGQGGGRHFPQYGAASNNLNSASVPAEGVAALMQPPSALVPGQAPLPVPTQVSSTSFWRPPRMAWCELCRVDCNTPEILEQHKNGKRHKKYMQVYEELQKLNKVKTEQQNAQMPNTELKTEVGQPVKVEGFEEKQPLQENLTSEVVTDNNRNETDQKDTGANSEASAGPGNKSGDHFAARGRGFKRRIRGGRGGKYMRTNEGSRRPVEPPKPKQVIPFICELCNIKCESQVVFDSHLSGKKHLATLKRFHGHRALYGEVGLQALYPSNFNAASTSAAPTVQQGDNDPQALLAQLLMTYVLTQTQAQGSSPASAPASAVAPVGTHNQLELIQGLQAMCQDGSQNAVILELKRQLQCAAAGNPETNTGNGTSEFEAKEVSVPISRTSEFEAKEVSVPISRTSEFEAKEVSVPISTSVVASAENPVTSEQVSQTASDKECGAAPSDPIFQPKAENQMQEPESKKEERTE